MGVEVAFFGDLLCISFDIVIHHDRWDAGQAWKGGCLQ